MQRSAGFIFVAVTIIFVSIGGRIAKAVEEPTMVRVISVKSVTSSHVATFLLVRQELGSGVGLTFY